MKLLKYLLITLIANSACSQTVEWTELSAVTVKRLEAVSACDGSNAWVCGEDGTVIRTSNGGGSWFTVSIPRVIPLTYIYNCSPVSAFVSGTVNDTAFLYHTQNSGLSWNVRFFQPDTRINFLWMFTQQNGILVSDPVNGRWSVWTTGNGGITWDSAGHYLPQYNGENGFPNSFYVSNNMLWFGTDDHRIYYSADYGNKWFAQATGSEKNITSIWMHNNEGYAAGNNIISTTNYGVNWTLIQNTYDSLCGGFGYYPFYTESVPGYLLAVRNSNKILVSSDHGYSWNFQYTAPSGRYTRLAIARYNLYPFWAIRDNGGISKGMVYFGIKKLSNEIPGECKLYQNYPNPFNPKTKIRFNIPYQERRTASPAGTGLVSLVIYNSLGQEVITLVNDKLQAGNYEVEFDGSNYPSGVYFYSLLFDDNVIDTKKMLLIK